MSDEINISFDVVIPEGIRHIADDYLIALYSAQDAAAEEYAEAYRLQVIAVDALASHELYDSIRTRPSEGMTGARRGREAYSDVVQAQVMEEGRKPGLPPPPAAAIYRWMHHKAMEPSWSGAYAIANAIGRRGIKARHPARRAFMIAEPRVLEIFESAIRRTTNEENR
jgi:hypothetical protein